MATMVRETEMSNTLFLVNPYPEELKIIIITTIVVVVVVIIIVIIISLFIETRACYVALADQAHYIAMDTELPSLPASGSQALRLGVWATTPSVKAV